MPGLQYPSLSAMLATPANAESIPGYLGLGCQTDDEEHTLMSSVSGYLGRSVCNEVPADKDEQSVNSYQRVSAKTWNASTPISQPCCLRRRSILKNHYSNLKHQKSTPSNLQIGRNPNYSFLLKVIWSTIRHCHSEAMGAGHWARHEFKSSMRIV